MKSSSKQTSKNGKETKATKTSKTTPNKRLTVEDIKSLKAGLEKCEFGDKSGCGT